MIVHQRMLAIRVKYNNAYRWPHPNEVDRMFDEHKHYERYDQEFPDRTLIDLIKAITLTLECIACCREEVVTWVPPKELSRRRRKQHWKGVREQTRQYDELINLYVPYLTKWQNIQQGQD